MTPRFSISHRHRKTYLFLICHRKTPHFLRVTWHRKTLMWSMAGTRTSLSYLSAPPGWIEVTDHSMRIISSMTGHARRAHYNKRNEINKGSLEIYWTGYPPFFNFSPSPKDLPFFDLSPKDPPFFTCYLAPKDPDVIDGRHSYVTFIFECPPRMNRSYWSLNEDYLIHDWPCTTCSL